MIRLALILSLLAGAAQAECFNRDHLAAFLQVKFDLRLRSWGLNEAGNMVELFLNDKGNWAVIETTPARCASVAMPFKEWGRLAEPPRRNKQLPIAPLLDMGSAL